VVGAHLRDARASREDLDALLARRGWIKTKKRTYSVEIQESHHWLSAGRCKSSGVIRRSDGYLRPMTIESGPSRCSARVSVNPASLIQVMQSDAV
jgi:hypothetical protein